MFSIQGLLRLIAWDGALPLIVISAPFGVEVLFPNAEGPALLTLVLLPPVMAMARTSVAYRQLQRVCDGSAPLLRQFTIALAIILLLLFELGAGACLRSPDLPLGTWCVILGFWGAYLGLLAVSLRPYGPSGDLVADPDDPWEE